MPLIKINQVDFIKEVLPRKHWWFLVATFKCKASFYFNE
jgi:hypothetical protein